MPGDDDGLTPDAAPAQGGHDEHSRIADKRRFSGTPEVEGVPEDEDLDTTEVDEQLDRNPEGG